MRVSVSCSLVLALLLGACSPEFRSAPSIPNVAADTTPVAAAPKPAAYVAFSGGVNVFGTRANPLITTITSGVDVPAALAFDRLGTLYVANAGNNTVTAYAPGKKAPQRSLSKGISKPAGLAVKQSVAVLNTSGTGSVAVFSRFTGALLRSIAKGIDMPFAVAYDPANNLYVGNSFGNGGSVSIYPPGAISPVRQLAFGSSSSAQPVLAMALDSKGKLYVGTTFVGSSAGTAGSAVFAFPPGKTIPSRILRPGEYFDGSVNTAVIGLATDYLDNVYVAVASCSLYSSSSSSSCAAPFAGAVVEFGPHGTSPKRIIGGLIQPNPMGVDHGGNLYVGDCSNTACTGKSGVMHVYAAGKINPQRTIIYPNGGPFAIATPPPPSGT